MEKEIVMYARSTYCPQMALARDLMDRYNIPYREIHINDDQGMAARVKAWTGYYSVPRLCCMNTDDRHSIPIVLTNCQFMQ
jgi:glutaredoxin